MASAATLQRVTAKVLSDRILEEASSADPSYAIIDVRDDGKHPLATLLPRPSSSHASIDHLGGHIKGSTNVPIRQLDVMMPTLVRKLQDKKVVVFHCALSRQRGPSAALKYLRERDGHLKALGLKKEEKDEGEGQEVFVLDKGFVGWQETYGEDERLTEAYSKEIWRNY
jgi:Cdc25 family phosphatase